MTVALGIILGWLALTTLVGVAAGLRRSFSLEEFFVGGRSFGAVIFYTVAAAEIYSAFAFLGLAGWAFGKGISIVYGLAYGSIAYGLYFFIGPRINRLGRRGGYVTQPDFFADRFDSKPLALLAAGVGVVFIIPYLQLQLMGAGMIVQLASGGTVSWQAAVLIAAAAVVITVYVSGLRGIGWTSLMQALIMLVGMFAVGILFPAKFFGGLGPMFDTLERVSPSHLNLPDSAGLGLAWYTSTALLCGLGMWMWPHVFAATYSARSEQVVRRNATILPLFQLAMLPVIIVGFTCAALAATDPAFKAGIDKPDHAMIVALVGHFPRWVAGLIGAGGLAAAVSTAAALILCAANLIARNLVQKGLRPDLDDLATAKLGRLLVPIITAVAVLLVFGRPKMLVTLLLMGYAGISQFVPAVLLGLFARWPTRSGILAGLVTGLSVVVVCTLAKITMPWQLNSGFVGLGCNLLVVGLVSPLTQRVEAERLDRFERWLGQ